TLHSDNFNADLSELTLAPRDHLTLKTGSRIIPIPAELRAMIRERLNANSILFPQRARGKKSKNTSKRIARLLDDPKLLDRKYLKAQQTAADTVGISTSVNDARVGRRC